MIGKILPPVLLGSGLVAAWELYVRLAQINPLLLPPPSAVARFLADKPEIFWRNGRATLTEIAVGFGCGLVAGLALGTLMQLSRWFRAAAYPWLVATQMVPITAVAPILVLWFGFTLTPKAVTVALMCFFPIAVSTVDGLGAINPELIRLLRSFGAGPWRVLTMAALPSALPRIFSGVRVAVALSVAGAVVGEWVGADRGLGYLMLHYQNRGQTAGLFATVVVLAAIGISLFFIVGGIERLVLPWKKHARETL